MKKNFDIKQTLKSGGNCDKYSKRFLYKNLVGGTTTIDRGYKQIRRLFLSSADKPLTAVGTLTTLLCNSAKVMENLLRYVITRRTSVRRGYLPEQGTHANKESLFASVTCFMRLPRRIQRMLFVIVTIPTLAIIFTIAIITESRAECEATEQKLIKNCYEWNPGVADNCGDGCTYNYNNGKLTVTATKPDAVVSMGMFSPRYYESGNFPTVSDVEIDGEFKTIAHAAFNLPGANIHGKDWVLKVNKTGSNSFDATIVTGTVIVNDGLTILGDGPWSRLSTGFNGTLILPPSITSVGDWFLTNLSLGADAKVYCGAEKCEELFRNFDCDEVGKTQNASWITSCKNHLNDLLSGKLLAYPDGCTKMGAKGCTKCKNENFKLNDGECDRLRWTPAEAAKVLRDDNTNEVTITFKK
jgi:hypothetical protein